jgi:tetratricopeptide (TPR) repeat protein
VALLIPAGSRSQTPDLQAKFRLAQGLEQAGEHERAAEVYRDLFRRDPQNYAYFDGVHRTAMTLKRYEEAVAVIKARLTFFPSDIPLHAMLGTAYYRSGQEQTAMDAWDQAIALAPGTQQTYRVISSTLVENRLLDRAAEVYRQGRTACKDPSLFTLELAQLCSATMDYAGATREYLSWLAANPTQISFIQGRMGAYSWKPDGRTAAIAAVREALHSSENLRLYELLGWLHLEGKEFQQAFDVYRHIDELSSAHGVAILEFAERVFRERAYDVALSAYREALSRELPIPRVPQARFGSACAAMELQIARDSLQISGTPDLRPASESRTRFAGALASFDAIVNEYPNTEYAAKALYQSATIHLRQYFDLDLALQTFQKVLTTSTVTPLLRTDVQLRLGEIQICRADTVAAMKALRVVTATPSATPDQSDEAQLRLAELAFFNGHVQEAIAMLDSVSANTQHDFANDALDLRALLEENAATAPAALALFGRAEFLARQRKSTEAIAVLSDLVTRYPRTPIVDDAVLRMATLYTRAGMFTDAVAACDRLLTELREQCRVPDRALFQKAAVLQFGLRQNAEAITAYERLLIDFPSSVFAGESRKRIRQLRGDVL